MASSGPTSSAATTATRWTPTPATTTARRRPAATARRRPRRSDASDPNTPATTICTPACFLNVCGDGHELGDEECDDGGANDASADCTPECTVNVCGDGFEHATDEECDDGNESNTDACLNTCEEATCGDGYVQADVEQCDDGNAVNTDGCIITEDGGEFSDDPAEGLNCAVATCGDGYIWAGREICDDGNRVDSDTCKNNCSPSTCGNGTVDAGLGEQCDDRNVNDNDSCLQTCLYNSCGDGFAYTTESDGTASVPNNPNALEDCDDANDNDHDDCLETCEFNTCGDGILHSVDSGVVGAPGVEECDAGEVTGGNNVGNLCLANCTRGCDAANSTIEGSARANMNGGHCYLVFDDPETQADAADACAALAYDNGSESYLVSINSAAENTFLRAEANAVHATSVWIGLGDADDPATTADEEGHYRWLDGTNATYLNWAPANANGITHEPANATYGGGDLAQPNDADSPTTDVDPQDCGFMVGTNAVPAIFGFWYDVDCDTSADRMYACEYVYPTAESEDAAD